VGKITKPFRKNTPFFFSVKDRQTNLYPWKWRAVGGKPCAPLNNVPPPPPRFFEMGLGGECWIYPTPPPRRLPKRIPPTAPGPPWGKSIGGTVAPLPPPPPPDGGRARGRGKIKL